MIEYGYVEVEIFNFIKMFYNLKKRHSYIDDVLGVKFEVAYYLN